MKPMILCFTVLSVGLAGSATESRAADYRCEVYLKVESGSKADTRESVTDLEVQKDTGVVRGEFKKIGQKFEVELRDGSKAPTGALKGFQILHLRIPNAHEGVTAVYDLGARFMSADGGSALYYYSVRCSR